MAAKKTAVTPVWPVDLGDTKKTNEITDMAKRIVIDSPETEMKAREYFKDIGDSYTNLLEIIDKLKRPHLDFNQKVDKDSRQLKADLLQTKDILEKKIIAYTDSVAARKAIEDGKALADWQKDVDKKEANAERKGLPVPILPPAPQTSMGQAKTVSVGSGAQTTVQRKTCELIPKVVEGYVIPLDADTLTMEQNDRWKLGIPAKYFLLDYSAVRRIVIGGGDVPGFKQGIDKGIANRV